MRTAAKTFTYAFMHMIIAFFIALAVSGSLKIALGISLLEPFVQTACFGFHEYVWEKYRPGSAKDAPNICCAEANLFARFINAFKKA